MPILAGELRFYRSKNISNTAGSNGGRLSANEIVDGVNNNVFPDVSQSERTAGATHHRKVFVKNTNPADKPLLNSRVFMENYTPGDDAVVFIAGGQNEMQSSLTGSERVYGAGKLDVSSSIGADEVQVLLENPAILPFLIGDVVRVSDKANISAAGNEEFLTLDGVSVAGSVATLSFAPGQTLQNAYAASTTRVASVYQPGTIQAGVSSIAVLTADNGDFDHGTEGVNLKASNIGSVDDQWTLTFTSATAFTATGMYSGALANGSTLSTYAPLNPDNSSPYFTIAPAGFTGTWQAGDTLTFATAPAAKAIWAKRVVPAGAAAVSGNKAVFGIDGETA